MARQLLLLRHGSVAPEHAGRLLGATDVPLGDAGRAEVRALAPWLRTLGIGSAWVSPLRRARETADLLGLPARVAEDLREVNFGRWELQTFAQVAAAEPAAVEQWTAFGDDFTFPGGERLGGFLARIARLSAQLAADPADVVLSVTHGGIIRALICQFLGLPARNYMLFDPKCATCTRIELFGTKGVLSGLNLTIPRMEGQP